MGLLWHIHVCVCVDPPKCHCNHISYLQGLADTLLSNKALGHFSQVLWEMPIKFSDTLPCVRNLRTSYEGKTQRQALDMLLWVFPQDREKVCVKMLHYFKLYESETSFWCYLTHTCNVSIPCFERRGTPLSRKSTGRVISMEPDITTHTQNWGRSSRSLSVLSFIHSGELSPLWLRSGLWTATWCQLPEGACFFSHSRVVPLSK